MDNSDIVRCQGFPQVRVLSFIIGFDETQGFHKTHEYGIKPSKWHDLTVRGLYLKAGASGHFLLANVRRFFDFSLSDLYKSKMELSYDSFEKQLRISLKNSMLTRRFLAETP